MIFLIDKIEYEVVIYDSLSDLTSRVEWQDLCEGKALIIDEFGVEYEWDSRKKDEIGTVYNYSLIPTSRISELVDGCLRKVRLNNNITEFKLNH